LPNAALEAIKLPGCLVEFRRTLLDKCAYAFDKIRGGCASTESLRLKFELAFEIVLHGQVEQSLRSTYALTGRCNKAAD
jgi:hypothetical protein